MDLLYVTHEEKIDVSTVPRMQILARNRQFRTIIYQFRILGIDDSGTLFSLSAVFLVPDFFAPISLSPRYFNPCATERASVAAR